jgi:hypothetical protein
MKSAQQVLMCTLVCLPVANAQAKDANANGLDFGVSADYSSTDNAKRSAADELAITEIQTTYQASIGAHYQNDWSKLISGYEVRKETFQRASQPDATELEGKTQLTLGNDYQPLSLTINHSRTAMLNSPEALDFASNRDTQELITIAPAVKTHFSAADSFVVMGTYTDVSYKIEQQKKSEQQGLQVAWIHGVSKTDTLQFTAQHTETTFEFVPQADYQLQNLSAQYSVTLKRFNYSIQAGYNRAESKISTEDFASPSYNIQASYISGTHTFALSLAESITDSSMGGGNSSIGSVGSSSGAPAKGVGIDLINVRKANVSWRTSALCERCDFGINISQSKQDYKELSEDGDEYGAGANFQYSLTRAASVDVSYSHRERKFSAEGERTGFKSDDAKVGLNYAITRGLQLELYANQEKRTSVMDVQNYQENIVGLNLSYHF